MLQQYVRLAPNHDEAQRREELSLIASAVVDQLQNGDWDPRATGVGARRTSRPAGT